MPNNLLIAIFIIINLAAFLVMLFDKNRSKKAGAERIPEVMLFFLSACFGSFGVFLGMLTLRHKTQKWYFILGIPLMMAENCATLWVIGNMAR
jgi:uncharacterized membrane protein YsdA (DUF1294 family)